MSLFKKKVVFRDLVQRGYTLDGVVIEEHHVTLDDRQERDALAETVMTCLLDEHADLALSDPAEFAQKVYQITEAMREQSILACQSKDHETP